MKKIILIPLLVFGLMPTFFVQATEPIKILLVPGHDNESSGAEYGNIKEADMNLRLATSIYDISKEDKRFKVYITRNWNGYTKEFANYFTKERENIISFKEKAKEETKNKISNGTFVQKQIVPHNLASQDMSIKLFGINKWANENKIDAVLHVHFNDVPRPDKWTLGEYKGFVIYMPEKQMANSKKSIALAKNIFSQLEKKYITSTLPQEEGGMIPDQKLIAIGASGTLNSSVRSLLVEYGYIYRFGDTIMRHKAYKDMANLTTKGIVNYFYPKK